MSRPEIPRCENAKCENTKTARASHTRVNTKLVVLTRCVRLRGCKHPPSPCVRPLPGAFLEPQEQNMPCATFSDRG
eukprot:1887592-Prymnesium_polylepis.1